MRLTVISVAHVLAPKLAERELEDAHVPQPLAARNPLERVSMLAAIRDQGSSYSQLPLAILCSPQLLRRSTTLLSVRQRSSLQSMLHNIIEPEYRPFLPPSLSLSPYICHCTSRFPTVHTSWTTFISYCVRFRSGSRCIQEIISDHILRAVELEYSTACKAITKTRKL